MAKREIINGLVNRIKLVGIELEGGWQEPVSGEEIIGDGSVHITTQAESIPMMDPGTSWTDSPRMITVPPKARYKGEVVSRPMFIALIEPWVRRCYPSYVNETCGLHVHMSFEHKLNYSRVMVPEFTTHMLESLKGFGSRDGIPLDHHFWRRVGRSDDPWTLEHCEHHYRGDRQVLMRRKDYQSRGTPNSRYTAINYCYNMGENGHPRTTVECRLLPMFETADQSIRAIMAVVNATNGFLAHTREREQVRSGALREMPEVFQEFGVILG